MERPDEQHKFFLDGQLVAEQTESFALLKFFYQTFLGKCLRFLMIRKWVSCFYSWYQKSSLSRRKIKKFILKHKINLDECEKTVDKFRSFNEFFCRRLKSGSRKIDKSPNTIVAPADSKLTVIGDISQDVEFFVKNKKFNLERFFKSRLLAQRYEHGCCMIFRLAPYDYHRFHFPVMCITSEVTVIHGVYESVNPLVYKSGVQPLTENERRMTTLETERFGNIVMVVVGALLVGHIVEEFLPGRLYDKGEEMGYFEFGGSTVVLLFEAGIVAPVDSILKNSLCGIETAVKVGQSVASIKG